ncbi:caffeic acid 3-O-methyltransferase 1-like [Henckelia pumila]|uniref:caffeic acid 3-O-methyltransferase 1-like n=1 Tax=Henckelia pumila TaxID=405737 RepID=UPI003C6E123A
MEKQVVHDIYCNHGNQEDDETFVGCLVACGSHVLRLVLNTSMQLDLFEIIDKSGDGAHISASEIASQLQTRNVEGAARVLDSMLRVLVTHSFLTFSTSTDHGSTTELRYGIAPKGKFLVPDERGVSLAKFYALTAKQELFFGPTVYVSISDWFKMMTWTNQKLTYSVCGDALGSLSTLSLQQIVTVYNGFEGLRTLVDVGGGNGATLGIIISKYSSIRGINFDSLEVIRTAPTYEVEHISGDMFVQVPKGDAIILKAVLHNWDAEKCVKLLKNCYEALPKKGKVIVLEHILQEIPGTDVYSQQGSLWNIVILSMNGKERTKGEYEAMAMEAGFAEFKVLCRAYGVYVMELVKF